MSERVPLAVVKRDRLVAITLGVAAVSLSAVETDDGMARLVVAACAGGVLAIGHRIVIGLVGLLLVASWLALGIEPAHRIDAAAGVLLAIAALVPRRLPSPHLPHGGWVLLLIALASTAVASAGLASDAGAGLIEAVAAILAMVSGFSAARALTGAAPLTSVAQYALSEGQWLSATTRFLLLGRIAGGMSHELSQALNVITMANGNLGYILDRLNLPEQQGRQMTERVRKIATHADAAGRILGLYRWFGQDGSRDQQVEMTVGTALDRAVGATRALARKSGVAIETRGDGLDHPVPLRHGTIELMTAAALLEVLQRLAERPDGSELPEPIVLEATRTQTDIEISVLCRTTELPAADGSDPVARATYDLVAKLAASCRGELRRVGSEGHPVQFLLRLNRDLV